MSFGNRLKELRCAKGLSQTALGEQIGVTKSTISYYESGSRVPTMENLEALCDIFNVDMDYLTGRQDVSLRYLSTIELEIIDRFRRLDSSQQDLIIKMLGIKKNAETSLDLSEKRA